IACTTRRIVPSASSPVVNGPAYLLGAPSRSRLHYGVEHFLLIRASRGQQQPPPRTGDELWRGIRVPASRVAGAMGGGGGGVRRRAEGRAITVGQAIAGAPGEAEDG